MGQANREDTEGDEAAAAAAAVGAWGLDGRGHQTPHCLLLQSSYREASNWVDPGRRRDCSCAESAVTEGWQGAGSEPRCEGCVDSQTKSDPWRGESSKPLI